MAKGTPWVLVGSLRKGQTGKLYIKVLNDVQLTKDSVITMKDPRKDLDASVAAGRLTAEKAEGMKEKIPEYVKYDLYLAPNDDK